MRWRFRIPGPTSDAEDIMQNTFLRVWNRADSCTGKNVKSWIMTIARNLSCDSRKYIRRSVSYLRTACAVFLIAVSAAAAAVLSAAGSPFI